MPSLTAERDPRLDRLWELLPTIHRRRDMETNGGLRALLEIIAEQALLIEEDIGQRYVIGSSRPAPNGRSLISARWSG